MYKKLKTDKNYFIFILIYILIFVPIVILRFPDIRNEIKYFIITDSIVESKNFLILKYLGDLYPDKPPLYFWILYTLKKYFSRYFLQGSILLGTLIPSFFITTYFYKFIKIFKRKRIAFIYTLFLISIPFFIGISVFLRMDMLMTAFIFFSLYFFFQLYYKKLELNRGNIFKIYVFIFLAIITKGIAGFVIPVSVILVFLIFEKNLVFFKKIRFIEGIIFIIFLIGVWGVLILQQPEGKEYLRLLLGQETVGRIVKSKAHVRPFYYYIKNIPIIFYPYGVAILISILFYIKNMKNYKKWSIIEKIGFIWSIVPLFLFSCASGKLSIYLLPIFPGNIIILVNFFMRVKNLKLGKVILRITEIFSVFAIPFNYLLNKKRSFYKRMILMPSSIFIVFMFMISGIEIYNKNFSLKYVVETLKEYHTEKIISYKFEDMINLSNELGKQIVLVDNIYKLNSDTPQIIISRNKYVKDLEKLNLKLIYRNRMYSILLYKGD